MRKEKGGLRSSERVRSSAEKGCGEEHLEEKKKRKGWSRGEKIAHRRGTLNDFKGGGRLKKNKEGEEVAVKAGKLLIGEGKKRGADCVLYAQSKEKKGNSEKE